MKRLIAVFSFALAAIGASAQPVFDPDSGLAVNPPGMSCQGPYACALITSVTPPAGSLGFAWDAYTTPVWLSFDGSFQTPITDPSTVWVNPAYADVLNFAPAAYSTDWSSFLASASGGTSGSQGGTGTGSGTGTGTGGTGGGSTGSGGTGTGTGSGTGSGGSGTGSSGSGGSASGGTGTATGSTASAPFKVTANTDAAITKIKAAASILAALGGAVLLIVVALKSYKLLTRTIGADGRPIPKTLSEFQAREKADLKAAKAETKLAAQKQRFEALQATESRGLATAQAKATTNEYMAKHAEGAAAYFSSTSSVPDGLSSVEQQDAIAQVRKNKQALAAERINN